MANFARILGGGIGYPVGAPVSSDELNQLDIARVKGPNFDEGSVHIPSADIILTGPFGIVSEKLQSTGALTAVDANVTGTLTAVDADLTDADISGTLTMSGGTRIQYSSRQVVRSVPLLPQDGTIVPTGTWQWVNLIWSLQQDNITDRFIWLWLTELPDGQELDEVEVNWKGNPGHPNDPVQIDPPEITVYSIDHEGTITDLGSATDTTLTRALYEAPHAITVTGLAHTIDRSAYRYGVLVQGEGTGTGTFIASPRLNSMLWRCNVTSQSEA